MIYKAQWPLYSNEEYPMIMIYPDADRDSRVYFFPATAEYHKQLFQDKFVKVYFRGAVKGKELVVEKFVRKEEWL